MLNFLKEVSSLFEKCQFWWRCFLLVKNNILCKKSVCFWANERNSKYSDKIMSYKLWGKVTMFLSKCHFVQKKIEILGEMLTFSLSVHYYWKRLSFCKICLFLEKCDILCEGLYTLRKCQILIKNYNFLGYVNCLCVNFH